MSVSPVLDDSLELAVVGSEAALVSELESLLEPDESSLDDEPLDDEPLDDSVDDELEDSPDVELEPLVSTLDPLDSVVGDGAPDDDPSDDDDDPPFVPASVSSPPHAISTHQHHNATTRRILASVRAPPAGYLRPRAQRRTMDADASIHQADSRGLCEFR